MKLSLLKYFFPFLIFIFAVFSGLVIYRAAWFNADKHFSLLALSFLKNDLFLEPMNLPQGDYADFYAKQYLFYGPMPSILLMPFVFIQGKNFPQMTLSISSLIVVYTAIFFLCRKLKFTKMDSFWLANFLVFGTVYYFVGLVNISAYVSQAVATAFFVFALFEYFNKKRWFLIGLTVAAAGATRSILYAISVFFLLEIIKNYKHINWKRSALLFLIPVVFSVSMYGIYNYRRFHNFFDTGYTRNVSELDKPGANNKFGFFSIVHIPTKLYLLLFMPPEPIKKDNVEFVLKFPYLKANGFGMAIWFTSPLFIYLIAAKRKSYTTSAVSAILILGLLSSVYSGTGSSQYGYRYSLDFLPFLFLILLSAFRAGLPTFAKFLIALGIIFNSVYMLSIWNSYPLFSFWEYF